MFEFFKFLLGVVRGVQNIPLCKISDHCARPNGWNRSVFFAPNRGLVFWLLWPNRWSERYERYMVWKPDKLCTRQTHHQLIKTQWVRVTASQTPKNTFWCGALWTIRFVSRRRRRISKKARRDVIDNFILHQTLFFSKLRRAPNSPTFRNTFVGIR